MSQVRAVRHSLHSWQGGHGALKHFGHTASRQRHSSYRNVSLLASGRLRSQQSTAPTLPFTTNARRYQSTQAQSTSSVFEQLPPSSSTSNSTVDLFEQLSDTTASTASTVAPHIGMLREAGLNFGWGPTSFAQWVVEHMYVYGLPWWGALVSTALLYRFIGLWPTARSSHYSALAAVIAPAQKEIKQRFDKMDEDPRKKMPMMQQEMRFLAKKTGYKASSHFFPIIAQGVFSFGLFRFSRNLCQTSGLEMADGGLLWFTDLQAYDPYFIVPASVALVMYLTAGANINRSDAVGSSTIANNPMVRRIMLYGLPGMSFAVLAWQPAGVQLAMTVLSVTTATTQQLLFAPRVREALGLLQFPKMKNKGVDINGRIINNVAKESTSLTDIATQMGMPGTGFAAGAVDPKRQRMERARGKKAVQAAYDFDRKRRLEVEEQGMRDRH